MTDYKVEGFKDKHHTVLVEYTMSGGYTQNVRISCVEGPFNNLLAEGTVEQVSEVLNDVGSMLLDIRSSIAQHKANCDDIPF